MFSGSMTALVTPFRDGRIDAEAFERLIEFQVANGTSALVPCGSTGESATLTHAEHADVVRLAVTFAKGRVPVIAGTGSNSTAEAITLTRAAREAGASAALLISPYYNKPTQEGIYRHYRAVAEATDFPLIVYNIPGRTASKIEAATIARLAEVKHIVGLKEATGSLDDVQEVLRLTHGDFDVYSGDDSLNLPIMAVGGVGTISVIGNIMPRKMADMIAACRNGAFDTARKLHYELLPVIRALFQETNPIPVKAAAAMMGLCGEEIRLPLLPLSDGPRTRLRSVMQEQGLL
jgi:4-hydroxy-tetrahydrodipicolinate synthase